MSEVATIPQAPSLLAKIASRYSVEPNKMLSTLKATAFKGDVSNEQMMALLIVSDQYGLNPWTKEIYAFPDKNNGIVPVVGVDGWSRIINSHPQFDGMSFAEAPTENGGIPAWIECSIYRKDRGHAIAVKEFFAECKRNVGPWQSHPRRMLRHKAMIQCARLAFGFVGIYDDDEAQRIITVAPDAPSTQTAAAAAAALAVSKSKKKRAEPQPEPGEEAVVIEAQPVDEAPQQGESLMDALAFALDQCETEDDVKSTFASYESRFAMHELLDAQKAYKARLAAIKAAANAV